MVLDEKQAFSARSVVRLVGVLLYNYLQQRRSGTMWTPGRHGRRDGRQRGLRRHVNLTLDLLWRLAQVLSRPQERGELVDGTRILLFEQMPVIACGDDQVKDLFTGIKERCRPPAIES